MVRWIIIKKRYVLDTIKSHSWKNWDECWIIITLKKSILDFHNFLLLLLLYIYIYIYIYIYNILLYILYYNIFYIIFYITNDNSSRIECELYKMHWDFESVVSDFERNT